MANTVKKVLALILALGMLFSMAVTVSADSSNDKVMEARNGVVQIQAWYKDIEKSLEFSLWSGTGFLINSNTVVTNHHVTHMTYDEALAYINLVKELMGITLKVSDFEKNVEIRVSILRDVYIGTTLKKTSDEMDYSVLTLDEAVYDRVPLALRSSSTVKQTEEVFALGFPGDIEEISSVAYYDTEDVTVTSGRVNKVGRMTFTTVEGNKFDDVDMIESSALIAGGNSGGPLVDVDGCVVGINVAGSDSRNLAISSDQLIAVLKSLGISYTACEYPHSGNPAPTSSDATESTEDPVVAEVDTKALEEILEEAEEVNTSLYTAASVETFEEALEDAEKALKSSSQDEIDDAQKALKKAIKNLEEVKAGFMEQYGIIVIIGGVVLLVLIVVIIVVVAAKGKKAPAPVSQQAPAQMAYATTPSRPVPPPAPQAPPMPQAARAPQAPPYAQPQVPHSQPPVQPQVRNTPPKPVSNETTVLSSNAGETTVLSANSGETTVLSQTVNGGTLVRAKDSKDIAINSASFTVGRERYTVDYCIDGNTNISRIHARFIVRDGNTFIVDNKAANGTFVNGVKLRSGQEVQLKAGDEIVLADEKFTFKK